MYAKKLILLAAILVVLCIAGRHLLTGLDQKEIEVNTEQQASSQIESEPVSVSNIRVALNTTGYTSLYHKSASITCTVPFTITKGETNTKYKAGKKIVFQFNKMKEDVTITPSDTEGRIKITTIKRNNGVPEYRGILHIYKKEKGLVLVNELGMEEYLYGVVPSEMPAGYGETALRVQAVCARTYAAAQKKSGKFAAYDADVDDSVSSQVYKNTIEDDRCNQAVTDTASQVMTYEGNLIDSPFFSTSCGYTTDYNDVWYKTDMDENPPYLSGAFQGEGTFEYDLTKDAVFKKFISGQLSAKTYEENEDWYRWSIQTTISKLNESVKKAGYSKEIGTLKALSVLERGTGGVVKKLKMTGSKGSKILEKQYEIRQALAPLSSKIKAQNGKVVESMSLLPSGYFYITQKNKNITIKGGGYGHGVGMSQNGVRCMAKAGASVEEILSHYYQGIVIESME